jgi:hypothetical protein
MRRTLLAAALVLSAAAPASAQRPSGLDVVRVLGPRATAVLAPESGRLTALVEIPSGRSASQLGVVEVAPGIGSLSGSPASLLAFGAAHPGVHVEVPGPLHTLLANAQIYTHAAVARELRGADGAGAAVGIVDTGIDPTLADFRDPDTHASRIAWLLDMSMKPLGIHPELEQKFGATDDQGNLTNGAVLTGQDIDDLLAKNQPIPQDPNGHGTHVASIAAGNGGGTKYIGMAPKATLIVARVTRDGSGTIDNGDTLQGAAFVFDRAAALGMPVVANFSLGTDFGPHDGNTLWEKTLASHAGPQQPGHAVVAAMGNSGSIVDTPIHQAVEVTREHVRIPITTEGATSGSVQIWVALRAGADLHVGLDGPDGTWVSPVSDGDSVAHNTSDYSSGVIFGSKAPNTLVPDGSHGAIVVWSGKWPSGTYAVTLEGHGYADLYLEGLGDAALTGSTPAFFSDGQGHSRSVREATVNLPATSPGIISVGCSIDSPSWTSPAGQKIGITEPVLDDYGGLAASGSRQVVTDGEVCYFSSAGPTLTGVPKPDILAPGAVVIGALSQAALPGSPNSIFGGDCPPDKKTGKIDPTCMQIDPTHAVALGTSMSSPMAAGVIALLLQHDPTLTEDALRALLQAGAHRIRGAAPFFDQSGPGEIDALGALEALDEMAQPDAALPDPAASWMTLSEDFAPADGSTPVTATLELRTSNGTRATLFDDARLHAIAELASGLDLAPAIVRGEAPGLFTFTVMIPPGHANESLTLGATFDGVPVVEPATIPVALDPWTAGYPSYAEGGCNASRTRTGDVAAPFFLLGLLVLRRRAR